MRQSSSHGPSMNACSSAVSLGACADRSLFQSGRPVNSSPSHHTVPASSASRSVSDIDGSRRRYVRRNGRVTKRDAKRRRLTAQPLRTRATSHEPGVAVSDDCRARTMPVASVAARRIAMEEVKGATDETRSQRGSRPHSLQWAGRMPCRKPDYAPVCCDAAISGGPQGVTRRSDPRHFPHRSRVWFMPQR
jgi:hypothetical protein